MLADRLNLEVEVKVPVNDLPALERRLRLVGCVIVHPRVFEANVIYDLPGSDLRRRGELIRIRQTAELSTFTYKGPATVRKHKEREELEVTCADGDRLGQILGRLGYVPKFRYEKYRTEWKYPEEDGLLMIDETPIGNYLEIEGPPEWIDAWAERLGYRAADYIHSSYARLYAERCAQSGSEATDMVFDK